ncbi:MAG: S8 family serine peptidase, partial [Bacteriovoracaceae bacterium]
ADGETIKEALKTGKELEVTFSGDIKKARTEYIDTITNFSSRGPRSEDGLIKPEIVAPGQQIISAATGKGDGAVAQNGTSMASPHMAGVMALMMQKFPELSPLDHKYILMATAKIIKDHTGVRYPVTAQGAGRVDVMKALTTKVIPSRGAFSLGKVNLIKSNKVSEKLTLKNISNEDLELSIVTDFNGGISLAERGTTVRIKKGETKELDLNFTLDIVSKDRANFEGFVKFISSEGEVASFPVLAVVHQASAIATLGTIQDTKRVSFVLNNKSALEGVVLPFNLIGTDARKKDPGALSHIRNRACDLESAGYRVINKEISGETRSFLQVGVKLYESVSDWQACQISVLIDSDNDDIADYEWVGTRSDYLPGLSSAVGAGFYSFVLDAHKAREIRGNFETSHRNSNGRAGTAEDYRSAVTYLGAFSPFQSSSVSVIEIDTKALDTDSLKVKVAALHTGAGAIEADDYLGSEDSWHTLNLKNTNQLPDTIEVKGHGKKLVKLPKAGSDIILYSPTNADGRNGGQDLQAIKL